VKDHIVDDMDEFLNVLAELLVNVRSQADGDRKPAKER
jgi:hypothetical protein